MIVAAALLLQAAAPASAIKSPPPAVADPVATIRSVVPYPLEALLARQQGRAVVRARISAKGKVRDCVIVATSGSSLLDKASCASVRGWAFTPAVDADHRAVEGVVERPIVWRLPQFPTPVSSDSPR